MCSQLEITYLIVQALKPNYRIGSILGDRPRAQHFHTTSAHRDVKTSFTGRAKALFTKFRHKVCGGLHTLPHLRPSTVFVLYHLPHMPFTFHQFFSPLMLQPEGRSGSSLGNVSQLLPPTILTLNFRVLQPSPVSAGPA